jgi:hypothetical protein
LSGDLRLVQERFKTIKRTIEALKLREATGEIPASVEAEIAREMADVDEALAAIEKAKEPTVTDFSDFSRIEEIAGYRYSDLDGTELPFLTKVELEALSVTRGTFTREDRKQMEQHVGHTYEFLSKISWPPGLQNIPILARAHHEKLDGSGYPYRLRAKEISPQDRMMAIADMFDGLAAQDRPYKDKVPTEAALDILREQARQGKLDEALLALFIDAKVYELATQS